MRNLVILTAMVTTLSATASEKVAYGEDNRLDVVDSRNAMRKRLATSTATQIPNKNLTLSEDGSTYALANTTLADFMPRLTRSWWNPEGTPLCKGEKFENQLAIGNCSGFLVGDKYLVTAGHCMTSQSDCDGSKWAFDYKKGEVEDLKLEASKVYSCKKILKQELSGSNQMDYAIVELDRAVADREPLKYRTEGKIGLGEGVFVIGSPSGLPLKIAGDSTVTENTNGVYFDADLDTFGGNSGSAVFNARTGEVEGILVRGARDYAEKKEVDENGNERTCMGVNFCEEGVGTPGCGGEAVTRIEHVTIDEVIKKNEEAAVADATENTAEEQPAPATPAVSVVTPTEIVPFFPVEEDVFGPGELF